MKLTPILFLISFSIYAQQDLKQTGHLFIAGQVELQGVDQVSKDRSGLLTKVQSTDSIKTIMFTIGEDGHFKIDSLKSGRYRLSFRVNEDYRFIDTVFNISENFPGLRITPMKWPCHYDAGKDIETKSINILVFNEKGLFVNSKADNSFEKKFKIRYLILSRPLANFNCLKRYNSTVFNHLDNKFGEKWRTSIRTDAIGFK